MNPRRRAPKTYSPGQRRTSHLWRGALCALSLAIAGASTQQRAAAQSDVQPPTVVSRSPSVGGTGVSTQTSVLVTFDEPIAPATLSLSLRAGTTPVPATVSYTEATRTATLVPTDDLAGATVHTAEVIARDVAGNLMPASVSWSFTTATPAFQQSTVLTGLTQPTVVQFAADGRVFIAEKRGVIKVFDSLSDTSATIFADLRKNVYNFWDRGLLGMALHPDFPATPYVYVLYAHDADIGGTSPKWGTATGDSDTCPSPPNPTGDGCVISARLSRLTANGTPAETTEVVLVENWFQQYPSHSIGSLVFGSDGMLYASGGDGASFNFTDYGQDGSPLNPGGDPPTGVGGVQTPPAAEGGALRAQDLRTNGDPVTLDGTIIRIDPLSGQAPPDNPLFPHVDPNGKRVVAYGLRNPFRITTRPGTREIWIGDVGWDRFEEINRLVDPTDADVDNFGWPCYEGAGRQQGYDSANLTLCENLYAANAVTPPFYFYSHGLNVSTETCGTGSSSISGLAFYQSGSYPSSYRKALFFSDYSRNCIWVMFADASGVPNPSTRTPFLNGAVGPADLKIGPGGDLFYVSLSGTLRRITYFSGARPPLAMAQAVPSEGISPLTVSLSATGSSDPGGLALTYAWDLDSDGLFDDAATATTSYTYTTAGLVTPRVRVTNSAGLSDVAAASVLVSESYPTASISSPSGSLTWQVGDVVTFSGSGSDTQDGVLAAAALTWELVIHHCPQTCHVHPLQTYEHTAGGSFVAPDHEYPSWLELRLTATDSAGLQHTASRLLYPKTVNLTFASNPSGLQLTVGPSAATAPFTRTVIVGSTNTVSAPGQGTYSFSSWSDGGAQTHAIVAPATAATYTAAFSTPASANLVAAYGFNETAGTVASDASGNSRTGTVSGATWNSGGRFGGALSFDGTNDVVTVADANALDLTNGMTLSAWLRPSTLSGWRTAVLKEAAPALAYALYAHDSTPRPAAYATIGGSERTVPGTASLPLNTWTHLATTYDGTTLRLFVNGTQVASQAVAGTIVASTGALRIGGNTIWGEYFAGLIDEVRIYSRALSAAEIQTDMNAALAPPTPDIAAPTVNISAPAAGQVVGTVNVQANAADDIGVTSVQFLLNGGNLGAADTTAPFALAWNTSAHANGAYVLSAIARDASGKQTTSAGVSVTVNNPPDTIAPTVGITAPAAGTVSGTISVNANATDNVAVASVQFQLNGANLGAADTSAPFSTTWNTTTSTNGSHVLRAIARDAAGNQTTSASVTVQVTNVPSTGLVAAYAFNETSGTTATDASGNNRTGTVSGSTWNAAGRFGRALSFDGVNDLVTIADANALDFTNGMTLSAWVRPTTLSGWRTAILKEAPSGFAYALYAHDEAPRPAAYIRLGTADQTVPGTTALALNAWSYLTATFDGATLRLFVNGIQVSSQSMSGSISASTGALRIGGNSVWGEYFAGLIDEVRIYNRALSAAEISTDMNAAIGGGQ